MDLLIVLYDFVKYDKYLFDIFLMINIIDIGQMLIVDKVY